MTQPVKKIVGAVLAAGAGSRMGMPKAELTLNGVRLIDRAIDALTSGGCDEVIAVVRGRLAVVGARAVINSHPERGLRSSLDLAVNAADGASLLVVTLVDMPGVGSTAIRRVIRTATAGRIAIAAYGERRGHPIAMTIDSWRDALLLAGPDEGARVFMAAHPDLVDEVEVVGDPTDLDRREDVTEWLQRSQPDVDSGEESDGGDIVF